MRPVGTVAAIDVGTSGRIKPVRIRSQMRQRRAAPLILIVSPTYTVFTRRSSLELVGIDRVMRHIGGTFKIKTVAVRSDTEVTHRPFPIQRCLTFEVTAISAGIGVSSQPNALPLYYNPSQWYEQRETREASCIV